MKWIYWMDNINRFLLGLVILIAVHACSVKKQSFSRVEIHKDSIHSSVDTSYHSKEVTVTIEGEESFNSEDLHYSKVDFNWYLDSLFAVIDTNCSKEQFTKVFSQVNGLWDTDTSYLETLLAKSHAVVEGGKLYHFLHQKDTIIKRSYDSLLQVIEKEREVWHTKEVIESSEKITRTGFNFKIIAIILIILVLAWIILKRLI